MTDLTTKTALIWDAGGDFTHIAEAIAPEYARVLYYVPWESSFSTAKGLLPGIGLEGIERVADFFEYLDDADILIFTDVGNYGLIDWLRAQGKPVFGCGGAGKYETDRLLLKLLCKDIGIDTAEAIPVRGLKGLRAVLETNEDLFVKLSYLRGESETRKHTSILHSEDWLNRLATSLGPYRELADFLIEVPIHDNDEDGPCVEIGFDSWCGDGQFPEQMLFGYELKDSAFVGCVGTLPERMATIRDKLSTALNRVGYRGAISTETRETEAGSFLIDLTLRFPSPPSELQSKLVANLGEVVWDVAHGARPQPKYRCRYGAQIVVKSPDFQEHPIPLEIGRPELVAIHGHCIIDGQDYAVSVSEIEEMAGAIGMGDTLEEAIREAYEGAESIKGEGVRYDSGALNKALECVREGEKLDLTFKADNEGESWQASRAMQ